MLPIPIFGIVCADVTIVTWTVEITSKSRKQIERLSEQVRLAYLVLAKELETSGPYRNNWKHFGKLRETRNAYHCHLVSGRPTYVTCWEIKDKNIHLLEIYYVGTHEGAPY